MSYFVNAFITERSELVQCLFMYSFSFALLAFFILLCIQGGYLFLTVVSLLGMVIDAHLSIVDVLKATDLFKVKSG